MTRIFIAAEARLAAQPASTKFDTGEREIADGARETLEVLFGTRRPSLAAISGDVARSLAGETQ